MTVRDDQDNLAQPPGITSGQLSPEEWLRPGMVLNNRYLIEKRIGRGGVGAVYLALDKQVASRPVVIKVLLEDLGEPSAYAYFKKKFRQEIEALSRIKHHGVVGVHDAGEAPDGKAYLVLEFVEGITLRAELDGLRKRRIEGMEFERVAYIMRQLGQALSAAHKENVYHRDLKPENIMLYSPGEDEEQVKVIDFGIATVKDSQVAANKTTTEVSGTLAYMAPEQLMGKPEAASDIYALGVIAYEMLTGRVPFNTVSPVKLYELQQTGVRAKPRDLRHDLDEAAEGVILKALSCDPSERYHRARDFGDELARALVPDRAFAAIPESRSLEEPGKRPSAYVTRKVTEAHPPVSSTGDTLLLSSEPVPSDQSDPRTMEIAHVLFMDIVGSSKLLTDEQDRVMQQLEEIVSNTSQFIRAEERKELMSLDRGDGMALVFFRDPEAPVRCALEIAAALKSHPDIELRMGANSGPVFLRKGMRTPRNVTGSGIVIAQRVMDCGDAGHILLSKTVADFLGQLTTWAAYLSDFGECEVKHGERVHLFNLCTGEHGNPQLPNKLKPTPEAEPPQPEAPLPPQTNEPAQTDSPTKEAERPRPTPPEAPPPHASQADHILTQIVGVSHRQDARGKEGLIYAPVPLGIEEEAPEQAFVPIKWQILQQHIEALRTQVQDLIWLAQHGEKRKGIGIEAAATGLARHVLPEYGFVGMMAASVHPQFDIIRDAASAIPWEVLEEGYFTCPNCHTFLPPHKPLESSQPHCGNCGEQMVWAGGKLALTYHLTHLVRGPNWASSEGNRFLIVQDPKADLCDLGEESGRICASHVDEIQRILKQQGYEIILIKGKNATVTHVLRAMDDPQVVGIYYFGHGFLPANADEGCLVLADRPLFASQIEELKPKARFVFLNACEAASTSGGWDLEKKERSVAYAFARGGRGRVVIASLWPLVSVQAARSALDFFANASPSSLLSEALKVARSESLRRYKAGEPDITWMAYRYFGDPNKTLPAPVEAPIGIGSEVMPSWTHRVFDSNGQMNTEVFAFAVDEVMLRAAKRRNLQQRTQVTITDFLAGVIRKGDLTRFLLRQSGRDPDEIYEKLCAQVETESTANDPLVIAQAATDGDQAASDSVDQEHLDETKPKEVFAKWIVRDKAQFAPQLVGVLASADVVSQQRDPQTDDRRISEQVMLESLLADEAWTRLAVLGLLPAQEIRLLLPERERRWGIDENGTIILAALDDHARKVIETAHILAQQRGIFPITNRVLLAAFLAEKDAYAARACRIGGVRPSLLYILMIAASRRSAPISFGLSPEACERIVTPVIEAARRVVAEDHPITEGDLFKAFCEVAGAGLKEFLRLPALGADLDILKAIDPDAPETPAVKKAVASKRQEDDDAPGEDVAEFALDEDARRVLLTAQTMAQKIGISPIPNRLLLAAFLVNPEGHTTRLFRRHGFPARRACSALIAAAGGKFAEMIEPVNADTQLSSEVSQGVVAAMLKRAGELSTATRVVTEPTLFKAFCKVAAPALKKSLKSSPLKIDLDALADDDGAPLSPGVKEPELPESGSGGSNEGVSSPTDTDLGEHLGENDAYGISQSRFEESAWRVLIKSARLARQQGWTEIRTPHLFAAMIGDGSTPVGVILQRQHLNPAETKKVVLSLVPPKPLLRDTPPSTKLGDHAFKILIRAVKQADAESRQRVTEEDLFKAFFVDGGGVVGEVLRNIDGHRQGHAEAVSHRGRRSGSVLSSLGDDLTEKARRGELPKIVGRDDEIDLAMQTLLLTQSANPLLVGEAGVGKTAIVEGIAQRIADGRCPQQLRSIRIIELSAGALVANTRLRGEFEQRIQELLAEARGDVILFIDEIHTIVGAGSGQGSGPDAANMLKAALARGEIKLIGATTHSEYKRTIERDKALSRRFQVQMIHAPTREATIDILSASQKTLEQHHGVRITRTVKVTAVDLSGRYLTDKQWPAKARDVLERACVSAATAQKGKARGRASVTPRHVAKVVSAQTGVPLERVSTSDLSALATLEERVSRRLVGQQHAIRTVVDAIRRGRQGLANANRPWGVFLFVGAPGVGKTELAKVLAEEVFGGEEGLIRFDMGDFTEPHSTAKLTGAPPGYVGYDQGAPLVERLRQHPYSLLLFDEIEHAHENVLAVLLRLFSEGTIADADGNLADARNAIVILTTNWLDPDHLLRRPGFAPEAKASVESSQTELRALLEHHLPSKLTDRLDRIIRFNPLALKDLEMIATRKLHEIVERVAAIYKISVEVGGEVTPWLAEQAASESYGARAIHRVVDEQVGSPLTVALTKLKAGETPRLRLALRANRSGIECASPDQPNQAGE